MGNDYEAPQEGATGKGRSLRDRLKDEGSAHRRQFTRAQFEEALDERVHRSGTRRLINGFFFVAYVSVGLDFVLRLIEKQGLIAIVAKVPGLFCYPLQLLWNPDPKFWELGPLHVYKQQGATLLIFAVVHTLLLVAHREALVQRYGGRPKK